MRVTLDPLSFLITAVAGWMNQHQRHVIEYLMEEDRVLPEQIGSGEFLQSRGDGRLAKSATMPVPPI
jgi:hypothetical protein